MTIGSAQDRRQFIQDKLVTMAEKAGSDRLATLREIAANVLSFSPVNEAPIATGSTHLPDTGTVIGKLTNDYGPDYTAMHFDLSTRIKAGRVNPRVTLPQIQEANSVVQQYAQEETNPLLIFTLPDDSGLQFVTGNLSQGNSGRLDDILRVSTYWDNQNRTALDCLNRIGGAVARGEVPEHAFRQGLSVQPVTQEFFKDYKTSYDKTVARVAETMDNEEAEQFTQTLFNRLLFIHFISKKGWTTWDGNTDYLKALWADYQNNPEQTNFHSDRLTVLFHEGMNTPEYQRNPTTADVIGQVPFLNGGLFDWNELDLKGVHVDDELISGIVGREGLFSQYNFTVTEATPLDTEVAVDPEMLGKLFEETVNERHSNGAYYTPRPVVSFMCREALKGYISSRDTTGLGQDRIAELVDNRDPKAITTPQALAIANNVAEMKTVDPACGSGAFLLGMLQEILSLNDTLFRAGKTPESVYQQKLDIITNNIYGADKDGLAVSTAMLRLWLSLAVDYEGEGIPDPLPNLDMKLAVGDSIAGPNPRQLDFTGQTIDKSDLRENIAEYTTAQGERKSQLRQRIGETKQQLRDQMGDAAPAGVVEWRIEFADVMLNGGFDTVIANPPYVQLQANSGELANLYKQNGYITFARTGDLYQLFFERGFQLLRPSRGILVHITSNSWLRTEYGKTSRLYFTQSHTPLILMDVGDDIFETAIVDASIFIAREGGGKGKPFRSVDMDKLADKGFPPSTSSWGLVYPVGETPWAILTPTEQKVVNKMQTKGTRLSEWGGTLNFGIKTGNNEAFIIKESRKAELVTEDPKSLEILKPVLRGQDIHRYQPKWAGLWLITSHNGYGKVPAVEIDEYPAIKEHLDNYYPQLVKRHDKGKTPYNLRSCAYHQLFAGPKLFWMEMTQLGRFSYSEIETYCNSKGYFLTGAALKYACAVLNSSLVGWLMMNTATTTGMGVTEWTKVSVGRIPLPQIPEEDQKQLEQLVSDILKAKSADSDADTTDLELKIDQMVYELYGLTNEEIHAVEESISRSQGNA